MINNINVALIGNPNTGKTSVFNALTGLNQKVGNYPGITVEKKIGFSQLNKLTKARILDLPGTYSLNASSMDESLVVELLLNKNDPDYPDVAVVITDVENLKRNLLLFSQIKDLEIPTILVVNMSDQISRRGIKIDVKKLKEKLNTEVILVSTRKNSGVSDLKKALADYRKLSIKSFLDTKIIDKEYFESLQLAFPNQSPYKLWLVITQDINFTSLDRQKVSDSSAFRSLPRSQLKNLQQRETIHRYQLINQILKETYKKNLEEATDLRSRLDNILIHKIWGYVIFFFILLIIFQSIFEWSSLPMDFIDNSFNEIGEWARENMQSGILNDLITEGVIPGLGGIIIFIPQIAFLFLFISFLEETGYMSRVVFLMDRGLRKYGLSGKSVVPLISGTACAIPAIMATRNIENWKDRLITILVVPFTTCSARLPVYMILISLVIPDKKILGINYQGLSLMGLYLVGFFMAIASASILNRLLKTLNKSYFVVEMPNYKLPLLKNILITVWEKTRTFIIEAGKIILAISILLWFMASFGPGQNFSNADSIIIEKFSEEPMTEIELDREISAYRLENSYIGLLGKSIEPLITPLGYDWKIGIALISSFAAREVFIGTLATIYSVGSDDQETIKNRMAGELKRDGTKLFNLATGISLMLFYAFAMQCMSTLAIVKKETNSWKWPIIQLLSMTVIAYLAALISFQLLK